MNYYTWKQKVSVSAPVSATTAPPHYSHKPQFVSHDEMAPPSSALERSPRLPVTHLLTTREETGGRVQASPFFLHNQLMRHRLG